MSRYQRPWWLVVNKSAGLVTTITEETRLGERVIMVQGEPEIQSLAWLTWGPVAAVLTVLVLAGLALAFNIKEQPNAARGIMIAAFLGLPALGWALATFFLRQLSQKHVQAERQAERQDCTIRINRQNGELGFSGSAQPEEIHLPFAHIQQARTSHALGGRGAKAVRLTLETSDGSLILLNESLGTPAQKADLAAAIQEALRANSTQ